MPRKYLIYCFNFYLIGLPPVGPPTPPTPPTPTPPGEMCCFTYGFGARMKPTSLNIIDCSEYDANDDHATVGGGKGKFKTCPKDAATAHEWVSNGNNNV